MRAAVGFSREFNGLDFGELKFAAARVRHAAVVD
jgi:hypothetical protein